MAARSCLLVYFSVLSFHSLGTFASVPFVINPGCELIECRTPGHPAIFYASRSVDDDTIHVIYSSLDELTVSLIQTRQGYGPRFNYTALFSKNYPGAVDFGDTTPSNSFSLLLRRLIQFTDDDDSGILNGSNPSQRSYWLNGLTTNVTDRPSFQLPLENVRIDPHSFTRTCL